MFRVPLLVGLALALAFGLGIASALMALSASSGFGEIVIGTWRAAPEAQTARADPYARAHRATAGQVLLGAAEGLRFIARQDAAGTRLTGLCRYRLTGSLPMARHWTLYAAGPDGAALAPAPGLPSALNSVTSQKAADGQMTVEIGSRAAPGNWLALPAQSGPFTLVLTLLDTPVAGSSGVRTLAMPRIEPIGCGNA